MLKKYSTLKVIKKINTPKRVVVFVYYTCKIFSIFNFVVVYNLFVYIIGPKLVDVFILNMSIMKLEYKNLK